jgi:Trypsin/PEP-CTERM motif
VNFKASIALTATTVMVAVSSPASASETLTTPATIGARIQSGTANGLSFIAQSRIVGVGSTGTAAAAGNPIYNPVRPTQNGVVALIIDRGAAGSFICSGSLLPDRRSILTAAHCVSDGAGTPNPVGTTAFFYGGPNSDHILTNTAPGGSTAIAVTNFFINPNYTGEVIDQNDIAVLRLADFAPSFATSYGIASTSDLEGQVFNIAGVGGRSTVGGNLGVNAGTGRLRQGFNRYDFKLGDAGFGGFFTDIDPVTGENFFGTASISQSILSDFDNGLAANDASCRLGGAFGLTSSQFCNLGLGIREVSSAGGDSGGPQFVNGRIASVTSYGLSFGPNFGDLVGGLQSSFGEFNGFVPTSIHSAFIGRSAFGAIPEPTTWAMLIMGFGLVGSAARRRRTQVKVSFA